MQPHRRLHRLENRGQVVDAVGLELLGLEDPGDLTLDIALEADRGGPVGVEPHGVRIGEHVAADEEHAETFGQLLARPVEREVRRLEQHLPVAFERPGHQTALVDHGDPFALAVRVFHDERRSGHQGEQQQRHQQRGEYE